ncbi:hypothetical protein EDL80_04910 [Ehrlichia ruminantium]|uniref:Uncharacterized protein n=1 Tax=Ehrlichia ruminantium TaxID=779 RepID=A0AAE6UIV9_EHRRU|nr:hypothetical protein [Ehrlichia ruminantium]QGR03865.1 hypothetical protein EDL80_04910 [Ehrlichia ruminantium]
MAIFGEFDVDIAIDGNAMHYVGKITVNNDGNFNSDLNLDHGLVGTLGHFLGHINSDHSDPNKHVLFYEFTQHAISPGLPEVGAYSGHIEAEDKGGNLVFNGDHITISLHKPGEQEVKVEHKVEEQQQIEGEHKEEQEVKVEEEQHAEVAQIEEEE